jgi:hypothetical protein
MSAPRSSRSVLGSVALAFASAAGASFTVRSALAAPKIQGVAETSVGYTDNTQSAPDVPLPGGAPRSGGVFVLLSPGVVVADASERSVQRLRYTYTYDLFVQSTNLSTSSNRLEYAGFFDLSRRVGLVVNAAAVQSDLYSTTILTPPGAGAVNALPAGAESFLAATADELMSFDLAPGWRGYEGAAVSEQTPLFDSVAPRTLVVGSRAGVERSFQTDAVGVEARADYSVVDGSLDPDGVALGEQRQIVGTGVALWRRDWGRFFSSRAEAGAVRVQRLNTDRGLWQPVGDATLSYATAVGDAVLAGGHMVTTNLLLGQTLLVDQVTLRGVVPITKKGDVLVSASSGYQRGSILDEDANLAAHVDAVFVDVGIGWQVTPSVLVGLRYQHIEQISDARTPPLPLSFVRNAIMVGTTIRFPPEVDMPRAYRAPQRVDRSDEIRDAVEPAADGASGQPGPS